MPREVAIIGAGYVGLPLAVAFAQAGKRVVCIDTSAARVAAIGRGESDIEDVPASTLRPLVDKGMIEAARNLGASRLRILIEIVLPQVSSTLMVGLTLSLVTMMSVLSVPLMINAQSPTMITANMAFRINAYGDYGVANALGLISLVMTGAVAWFYLRQTMRENAG